MFVNLYPPLTALPSSQLYSENSYTRPLVTPHNYDCKLNMLISRTEDNSSFTDVCTDDELEVRWKIETQQRVWSKYLMTT